MKNEEEDLHKSTCLILVKILKFRETMYISQDYTQFGGTESLENSLPDLQVCVFLVYQIGSTASLLLVKKILTELDH